MDEFYFEEGYVAQNFFVYVANASSGSRYLLEDYHVIDYFEYRGMLASIACDFDVVIIGSTKEAEAYFTTAFTASQSAVKTATGIAAIESSFTQTAIGLKNTDIDLFAFSDAAIQAQVDRIRDNNIQATEFFSVSADVARIRALDADAEDTFVFVGINERSRGFIFETQAAFSFVVDIDAFNLYTANLSSEFTQNTDNIRIRFNESNLTDNFNQLSNGDRVRFGVSNLVNEINVTCDFIVVRDAHLTAFDAITVNCQAVKTTELVQNISSNFVQTATTGFRDTLSAAINTHFSIFVSRNISYRPLNINFSPSVPSSFSTSIKKFGSHSLNGGQGNTFIAGTNIFPTNKFVVPDVNENFIIEGWVYIPSNSVSNTTFFNYFGTGNWFSFELLSTKAFRFRTYLQQIPDGAPFLFHNTTTGAYPTGWHHILFGRSGDIIGFWVDGLRQTRFENGITPGYGWAPRYGGSDFGVFQIRSGGGIQLDEWHYVKGTDKNYNLTGLTSVVPNIAPFVNDNNTIFLFHFDNNGNDDVTIQQYGMAAISSQASFSAAISGSFKFQSAISSQSTLTAVIGTVEDINLVAFTDGGLEANVNVKTENIVVSQCDANLSVDSQRTRSTDVVINSDFAIVAEALKIHPGNVTVSAENQILVDAVKTTDTVISLSANVTVTAVIGTIEDIILTAFTDGSVTTLVDKITGYGANLQTQTNLDYNLEIIRDALATAATEFTAAISADRLRDNAIANSAEFNQSSQADRLRQGVANVTASHFVTQRYFETEQGQYIEDGYFTESQITAVITASAQSSLTSVFTQTANIGGLFLINLVATSQADITATAVKQTDVTVSQSMLFIITAQEKITRTITANITDAFVVFCNGVTSGEINMVAFTNAALTAIPEANKPFSSSLSANATIFADTFDSLNSRGSADTFAVTNVTVLAVKTADAQVSTDSIASALTVAVKEAVSDVLCEFSFNVSAVATKTTNNEIQTALSTTASTLAVRTASGVVNLSENISLTANAVVVKVAEISTQSIASSLSVVARTAAFFINADVQSQVVVTAQVSRDGIVNALAESTAVIDALRVRFNSSQITTQSTVSATVGVIKPFGVVIASAMTFVAVVREIRLDEIEYRIPAEGWIYVITGEDREYDIIGETGIRSITGETRVRTIDGETRVYVVE